MNRFGDLLDYREKLSCAVNNDSLRDIFSDEIERFGFSSFVYAISPTEQFSDVEVVKVDTLQPEWMNHYLENKLFQTDYAVWWSFTQSDPLRWSEFWRVADKFDIERFNPTHQAAREFGVEKGVTIPIPSFVGSKAVVSLVAASEETEDAVDRQLDECLPYIRLCADLLHARMDIGCAAVDRFRLTQQKVDALRFLAEGRQLDEIAYSLKVSIHRVRRIMKECRDQLDAQTTAQMVGKARFLGIV